MKKFFTLTAASVLVTGFFVLNSDAVNVAPQFETEVACTWFPICKDPDFHEPLLQEQQGQFDFRSESELLISCTWFPICKDPDMPIFDERGSAAIA